MERAATASAPTLPSQKVSATLYAVCIALEAMIGSERVRRGLMIGPSVRFLLVLGFSLKRSLSRRGG
jgi:hypothetical protein